MNTSSRLLILRITAVAELMAAVVFIVLALLIPLLVLLIPAGALLAVAAFLCLLSVKISSQARVVADLLANGRHGTATITSMHQTSVYVNGQPRVVLELSVTLPGEPAYPVSLKLFVPMIYLGRLTDGRPLDVRVDPANREHVVIDWAAPA